MMNVGATPNPSPASSRYWGMLKDLSNPVKLELIALLSNSVVSNTKKEKRANWASRFAGCWQDSRTAGEIIEDIRQARTTNSDIVL